MWLFLVTWFRVAYFGNVVSCGFLLQLSLRLSVWTRPDSTFFGTLDNAPLVYGDRTGCVTVRRGGENCVDEYDVVINFYWVYGIYVWQVRVVPNHGPSNLHLTGTIGVTLSWCHIPKRL